MTSISDDVCCLSSSVQPRHVTHRWLSKKRRPWWWRWWWCRFSSHKVYWELVTCEAYEEKHVYSFFTLAHSFPSVFCLSLNWTTDTLLQLSHTRWRSLSHLFHQIGHCGTVWKYSWHQWNRETRVLYNDIRLLTLLLFLLESKSMRKITVNFWGSDN